MRRISRLLAVTAIAGVVVPALAQDRPVLAPTRDATIDYRVEGRAAGTPGMRIMFGAGGSRTRIEVAGKPVSMIIDRGAGRMFMVMTEQHKYMEIPLSPEQQHAFNPAATGDLTRKGTETIAGQRCTAWESRSTPGRSTCITDDGLMLRGENTGADGQRTLLVATNVTIAPLASDVFAPPPGYEVMARPAAPSGGAGRPGAPRP